MLNGEMKAEGNDAQRPYWHILSHSPSDQPNFKTSQRLLHYLPSLLTLRVPDSSIQRSLLRIPLSNGRIHRANASLISAS